MVPDDPNAIWGLSLESFVYSLVVSLLFDVNGRPKMQLAIFLLRNLHIFGGSELLKTSKGIDLKCQNIEYAWTPAVWQPMRRPVAFLLAQPQETLEKAAGI